MGKIDNNEVEKAVVLSIGNIVEYVPDSVVLKTIIRRKTGSINVAAFDSGEALNEQKIPFDRFVQIIDGKAEIVIDGMSRFLESGQSIVIPAHTSNILKANERFKMISTIIKSGYEDLS